MNYIAKNDLKHGAYYLGECRNATVARWDDLNECFVYLRHKFGRVYAETILHPDDDKVYDVFFPQRMLGYEEVKEEIPL